MAQGNLASWKGRVHVFRWCDRSYLFHSRTLEVVELSEAFSADASVAWKGEDPFIWCPSSEKAVWCHEFFSRFLMEDESQTTSWVRIKETDGTWRSEGVPAPLSSYRFGKLPLGWGGKEATEVEVMAQTFAAGGNFLWFSLPDIYALCGGCGSYARTRQKRWDSWPRHLQRASLPEQALLRGRCKEDAADEACSSPAPWAAVSTHGLLHLLLRWEGPYTHKGRIDALADDAERLLEALLLRLPHRFEVSINMENAAWVPPYGMEGSHSISIEIRQSCVNLDVLQREHGGFLAAVAPQLVGESSCSLRAFLEAAPVLSQQESDFPGCLPQLVWLLGSFLEAILLQCGLPELSKGHWHESSALQRDKVPEHMRSRVLRAYCQQAMQEVQAADVVSVALDDTRLGRKPVKVVAAAVGDRAFWCCPQAGREQGRQGLSVNKNYQRFNTT